MGKGDKKKKENKEKGAEPSGLQAMDEDEPSSGLPAHLDLQRTRVICGPEMNSHVGLCRGHRLAGLLHACC
jgi:hypothetical protein